jgi:hypothetical protein
MDDATLDDAITIASQQVPRQPSLDDDAPTQAPPTRRDGDGDNTTEEARVGLEHAHVAQGPTSREGEGSEGVADQEVVGDVTIILMGRGGGTDRLVTAMRPTVGGCHSRVSDWLVTWTTQLAIINWLVF